MLDYWYKIFKIVTRMFQSVFISKVIMLGCENIASGPKLYAGNHPNTADAMVLPNQLPERLYFLIYAGTFKLPFWSWLLTLTNHIPVSPGLGKKAVKEAFGYLDLGNSLVILLEGEMTLPGENRKPGTIVVRLSLKAEVPIVPLSSYVPQRHIRSLRFYWFGKKKSSRWQLLETCYVVIGIGTPWYPSQVISRKSNSKQIRQLSRQLMAQIDSLTQKAIEYSQS